MAQRVVEIASGVGVLPVSIANVYFVGAAGGPWALVDTGLPGKAEAIRAAAESRYGAGARPEAIFLTHGHFDHAGSARELADCWGVPILAHALEIPYLTGQSQYPPADPTAPGFMAFLCRFFKRQGFDLGARLQTLAGGEPPGMAGWEWLHTPGHAPGQVAFFRRSDTTLLAGDAFTTIDVDSFWALATKQQRVCRPPTPLNYDWKAARESVRLLADLKPFTLACGHGKPMSGNAATMELAALARQFPIPRHGRYVSEPARVDETGVVWLPPPAPDRLPKVAAGLGIAAGAALVVTARRRSRVPLQR